MFYQRKTLYDPYLVVAAISLLGLGLVMVTSASLSWAEGLGLSMGYFAIRHAIYLGVGLVIGWGVSYVPMQVWRRLGVPLLFLCLGLLTLLLVPGITREVNGSVRWLFLGPISIQVSELAKLVLIIYMAGYLVRHEEEIKTRFSGFLKPILILMIVSGLLLLEPDFGATVVIVSVVMGMLFLGGVPFKQFLALILLVLAVFACLSIASPYRLARLTSFLDPWADQFNSGYQLTQSLIAFGRGGWLGTGLGNGVQKLLYLPEPHNDFLYAVLSEELGLLGALCVLALFIIFVWRALAIGNRAVEAGNRFSGFIAYGIALWIGLQTMINMGVNMGVLPTKGLTLPLMSYGGNSLVIGLLAIGLLFRIDFEHRLGITTG